MTTEHRVNDAINREISGDVRLIDPDGNQIGVMGTDEALQKASQKGLDLVEVAPKADPPVCRILDYGKFKYRKSKQSGGGSSVELKTLKMSPQISDHDLGTKLSKAASCLGDGNQVRLVVEMRGRENKYADRWKTKLEDATDRLIEKVDRNVRISKTPTREDQRIAAMVEPD